MHYIIYLIGTLAIFVHTTSEGSIEVSAVGKFMGSAAIFGVYFVAWSYYLYASKPIWGRYFIVAKSIAAVFSISWVWHYAFGDLRHDSLVTYLFIGYVLAFIFLGERISSGVVNSFPMPESEKRKLGINQEVKGHAQITNFYIGLLILAVIPVFMKAAYS